MKIKFWKILIYSFIMTRGNNILGKKGFKYVNLTIHFNIFNI